MPLVTCIGCGERIDASSSARLFCGRCGNKQTTETRRAMGRVRAAIVRGDLPRPQGLPCADCGAPSYGYDHRDYARPLDVQPVCRGCNTRRGPALSAVVRQIPQSFQRRIEGADPSINSLACHEAKSLFFADR